MNPLKKGPELRLPELKRPDLSVPGPLADFYYDLRDRRLLPVLALVIVAIAATPILLGNKSKPVSLPPAASAGPEAAPGRISTLTVVEATPGLRDYHKRLGDRSPSDPFEPKFTGPAGGGGSSSSGSGGSGEGGSPSSVPVNETSETTTVEVEGGRGSGGNSGGSAPKNPQNSGVRLFEFVIDVQISHAETTADGGRKMSKPQVHHKVRSLTQLPSKKNSVVTVGGVNLHNGKVFLLVADEVRSLDGEFTCVTRAPGGLCELLELEPGFPLELVYGPNEVAYRLKVTKINTVWAGHAGDKKRSGGKKSAAGKRSKGKSSQHSQARSRAAFAAQPRAALAGGGASLPRP
jgi:hypothetical protein